MNVFDGAVALKVQPDGSWLGHTSKAYANMVGPFGGVTAAALLNAALSDPRRMGEPVALTVNFAAPVADGPYEIHGRIARSNRSTQHWSLELVQRGEVIATATSVFAQRRETWSAPEAVPPIELPRPEELVRAPLDGRPPWAHRYDMRFVSGGLPDAFDGREQAGSSSSLWIRDDPPRPLSFTSLAAICDSFFPRIYVRRRVRTAIGTVSMTTYFHADGRELTEQGDRFVLGVARALAYRNGYFDQSAEVFSDAGRLLASTHQLVYFRE